jgi:hypothetical protein
MLSVTNKPIMLSVVMLNVVMLSVVALRSKSGWYSSTPKWSTVHNILFQILNLGGSDGDIIVKKNCYTPL